jgi:phage terminase large subunit-like protein
VLLPKEAPWLHEYVAEITGFPGSRHADQVDSTTQALDHLRQNDDGAIWARLAAKTLREERGG